MVSFFIKFNTISFSYCRKVTSDTFTYQEDEQSGAMEFHMVSSGQQSQLLLKALLLGLDTVRNEYGKKYIDLKESQINKEV